MHIITFAVCALTVSGVNSFLELSWATLVVALAATADKFIELWSKARPRYHEYEPFDEGLPGSKPLKALCKPTCRVIDINAISIFGR